MVASVAIRRLRRFANSRKAYGALELLVTMVTATSSLLLSSEAGSSGKSRNYRGLFPSPFPVGAASSVLKGVVPLSQLELIDRLVVGSVRGLNFLNTSKRTSLADRSPSRAQTAVFQRLVRKWWQLALHMGSGDIDCKYDPMALARLIAKGSGSVAVPLQASRGWTLYRDVHRLVRRATCRQRCDPCWLIRIIWVAATQRINCRLNAC